MNGIVYVLTNPVMPELVKIGQISTGTTEKDLEKRVLDLSRPTGVPVPFQVEFACTVKDALKVEQQIHKAFEVHRENPKREFFRINPRSAVAVLKLVEIEDITPVKDYVEDQEEQRSLNKARNRQSFFRFSSADIPVDSEIYFSDDPDYRATVVDDRKVKFEGDVTSLSQASVKLLNRIYDKSLTSARGPDFWMYDGETLTDRRIRLENEDS